MGILDDALVKQFARITNDRIPSKKEDNLYGTAKYDEEGNFVGVIFDGSSITTPCTKVVDVEDGDRVIVSVRNREAVITGNVSRPAINTTSIETKDLTVKDKIQVYAPVWDPETQEFTGDFHTIEVVSMSETNPYYNEIWAFQKADRVLLATPFTDEYGTVHYPEVQTYNLGVNTLQVADEAAFCNPGGTFAITSHVVSNGASIAAGGVNSGTTELSKEGYYPIAVAGYSSSSRYGVPTSFYITNAAVGSGTLRWTIYNPSSSARTPTCTMYVLWVKAT